MVNKGLKPVAMMSIQNRYFKEAESIVKNMNGLKFHSEYLYDGWMTIYIYKHNYMLEIIKSSPDEPKTAYEHWILGKMFGYSDEEIGKFIESKLIS